MKKIFFLFLLFFLFLIRVNANDFNIQVVCPTSVSAGALITCDINATSSISIKDIELEYNLGTGVTYNGYDSTNHFPNVLSHSSSGINVSNNSGVSSNINISKVIVRIPSGAEQNSTHIVGVENITGLDSSLNPISAANVNTTVRIKSNINTLSSLTLSNKTFEFNSSTLSYDIDIDATTTIINATKTDPNSVVVGTGLKNLNVGLNIFSVVVTSETGINKTYILNINRLDTRDDNNNLISITFSNGHLVFDSNKTSYNLTIDEDYTIISYILEDEKASVVGAGRRTLNYGVNTIELKVIAENESEKIYTLYITRPDPRNSNNYLKKLNVDVVNIEFKKDILEYKFSVEYEVEDIEITLEKENPKSEVEYNEINKLIVGQNVFEIKVIAENSEEKIYTITVIRNKEGELPSNNTKISNLIIDSKNIRLSKNKYYFTFSTEEDKLNIVVALEDEKASYQIFNNSNLKIGSEITIRVIAEDGSVKNYIIGIVKKSIVIPILVMLISLSGLGFAIYYFIKNRRIY